MSDNEPLDLVLMSADLIADYVSNNSISAYELPALIVSVHTAFAGLSSQLPVQIDEQPIEKPTPAQIRKSITPDALISFVDGKPYKTLKRHLGTHGLDPYSYREQYGLPNDYPMVAVNYAAQRSELAKSIGLGQPRRQAEPQPVPAAAVEKPKRAARTRKSTESA